MRHVISVSSEYDKIVFQQINYEPILRINIRMLEANLSVIKYLDKCHKLSIFSRLLIHNCSIDIPLTYNGFQKLRENNKK